MAGEHPQELVLAKTVSRTSPRYVLSAEWPTVATVDPGEVFVVETHDCRTGTITRPDQTRLLPDTRFVNPVTGPISVRGARPGAVLMIDVHEVAIDAQVGLMLTRPAITALDLVAEPQLEIVEIRASGAQVGRLTVACSPMLGVLGVAPSVPVRSMFGGEHGGNMDTKIITSGSRVYLPVIHPEALLYFGDVHAAMGDGEVFLTGVEVAGRITASVTLVDDGDLPTPLVETPHVVAPVSSGHTLDEAATSAMAKAAHLLTTFAGLTPREAGFFMSAAGDLRVSQYLPGLSIHARFEIPFRDLDLSSLTIRGLGPRLRPQWESIYPDPLVYNWGQK